MDLRFFVRAACLAVAEITRCRAALLLLWAAALPAFAATSSHVGGADYLLPTENLGGFLETVSHVQSGTAVSKPAATRLYRAFDGQSYEMQEFRGRYVKVLLPADASAPFTPDHLEELVYRLDEIYALNRDILQFEPAGNGLLGVAFVSKTCGSGCGLIGAKGIEIQASPLNYELIIDELDAGRLQSILVHELVHNFDAFASYLHYLPDHAHAWTDFFENFAAYRYGRQSLKGEAPDDAFSSPVSAAWKEYVADNTASWTSCVRDAGCGASGLSANNYWAMPYYRMEALYGTDAMLRSFAFLSDYVRQNPAPVSAEAREGLRILSLAHGTGVNIACHMDSLKWPLSDQLRNELRSRFGQPDPLCDDADQDGFIAITGDCDERNPSRHALGAEIPSNAIDDDCDQMTDERNLVETAYGGKADNFVQPVPTRLPFEVAGSAANPDDDDMFSFPVGASGRVLVTLCADDAFTGWAAALDAAGNFVENGTWYVYRPEVGCTSATFDYGELTSGAVAVIPDASAGGYTLTASATEDLPEDHSVYLAAIPRAAGGVSLQISDPQRRLQQLGADELEVWIPGTDVRLSIPYAPETAVTLNRNSTPQLSDGLLYQARMRPQVNGRPLLAFSAGHLFRYQAGAEEIPQVDHRYSGAWFDPAHEGEGFIVEVLENDRALVYWFTYHADGRQRWMLGVGAVSGNRIEVGEVMDSSGGRFGSDFDPADVSLQTAGSLSISFQGCAEALVNYSIDNTGGSQMLTRLTHVYGHRCGVGDSPPASDLSGSWYDPAHDGEGFVVEQVGADRAAVYWFTYNAQGEQTWLFNTGIIEDNGIVFPELLQPVGGQFGRSFDPATVRLDPWGSLELRLDCDGGQAAYEPLAGGFSAGKQNLVNLTRLQGSGCAP